jgi:hypothetical protein
MPKLHSQNGEKGGTVIMSATSKKQLNHISTTKQLLPCCDKIKTMCKNDHYSEIVNTFRPRGVYTLRGLSSHQSGAL